MPGRSTPRGTIRGRTGEALAVCALLAVCIGFRAKTGDGWSFVGADSFAYVGAAKELVENHRYGFRLPDWYKDRPHETQPGVGLG